ARCHDHKFDAVSTRDYYALAGYLKSSRYQQAFIDAPERIAERARDLAALKAKVSELVVADLAPVWREQAALAARYLVAANRWRGPNGPAPADVARAAGLDATRLERWVQALRAKEAGGPDHPLHAWSQLVGTDGPDAGPFRTRAEALRAALH